MRVTLRNPVPTVEEAAKTLGVSKKRVAQIRKILASPSPSPSPRKRKTMEFYVEEIIADRNQLANRFITGPGPSGKMYKVHSWNFVVGQDLQNSGRYAIWIVWEKVS